MAAHKLIIIVLALVLAATGCQRATYRLGDRTFRTPDAALDALESELDETLASIAPIEDRIGGHMLVLLPNRARLQDRGLRIRGNVPNEMVSYMVTSLEMHYEFMAEALKRRGAFDHVETRRRYETTDPPGEGRDYYLWYAMHSTDSASWYLRVRDEAARRTVPVNTRLDLGAERTLDWLQAVEDRARARENSPDDVDSPAARDGESGSTEDATERLRRVERMRHDGLISDQEAEKVRRRILDDL